MSTSQEPRLARAAAMIADPARSRMLAYLLAGQYASAGELAHAGSVTAPTASAHLSKLLASGFVICEARGRHRYFRLADAEIAHALEALALVAERNPAAGWTSPARQRLRYARCCYGHLAGTLGVALFDTLQRGAHLHSAADGYALTAGGAAWLRQIGCAAPAPTRSRRFAYA
jgi:DNA-binding transcriptional ArsR family regulator